MLAQSRGTYVALLFALIPLFFGVKIKQKYRIISIIVILTITLFTTFKGIVSESVLARIRDFESLGGRKVIWEVAYKMIKENFWLGVGFGNFPDIFGHYSIQVRGWFANSGSHNVYISLLSELGVIGLMLYTLFQISIWRNIRRLSSDTITHKKLLYALFIYLVIGGMTNSIHFDKFYWFGFGIITSTTNILFPKLIGSNGDNH